jgi:hypothetical protein
MEVPRFGSCPKFLSTFQEGTLSTTLAHFNVSVQIEPFRFRLPPKSGRPHPLKLPGERGYARSCSPPTLMAKCVHTSNSMTRHTRLSQETQRVEHYVQSTNKKY